MNLLRIEDSHDNDAPSGALARGLRLLAALNDLETATVSGLVNETNLPKATVIRLLQALQAEGYAAQDSDTLTYRVTPKVASLSRSLIGKNQTESLAQVALDMLADVVKWPAEYLVQDGLSMLIQANNRERASIKLKLFERRRFPILESAAGVPYLSSVPVENQIRTYSWCNPPRIGRQRMRPALFTVRDRGASLSKAKCVRVSL